MTSVPYSLKAVDAETLGGLPASAFALGGTAGSGAVGASMAPPMAAAATGATAAEPALLQHRDIADAMLAREIIRGRQAVAPAPTIATS